MKKLLLMVLVLVVGGMATALGQAIPMGAKLYIVPNEGFEVYLTAALANKNVPVVGCAT
ncbi:MAG: hypothetical protein ABSA59_24560 [Terriglobia bacterium]|jgi:hypothetical protein